MIVVDLDVRQGLVAAVGDGPVERNDVSNLRRSAQFADRKGGAEDDTAALIRGRVTYGCVRVLRLRGHRRLVILWSGYGWIRKIGACIRRLGSYRERCCSGLGDR